MSKQNLNNPKAKHKQNLNNQKSATLSKETTQDFRCAIRENFVLTHRSRRPTVSMFQWSATSLCSTSTLLLSTSPWTLSNPPIPFNTTPMHEDLCQTALSTTGDSLIPWALQSFCTGCTSTVDYTTPGNKTPKSQQCQVSQFLRS